MRKLLRAKARAAMRKKGIQHMNKRTIPTDNGTKSYFALHWREYV